MGPCASSARNCAILAASCACAAASFPASSSRLAAPRWLRRAAYAASLPAGVVVGWLWVCFACACVCVCVLL
jgi:hypothetical protein